MTNTINETAPGERLVEELRWVHDMIRRDLDKIRDLSARIFDGAHPNAIRAEIGELQANSPLWKLRVNCLYYCRFVHSHHHSEDVMLFPALRRANPALSPIVDRLESDHRVVSGLLDEVEAAADHLVETDTVQGRQRIVSALSGLGELLLAHLAYEEEQISPTLRSWSEWPTH